MDKLDPPEPLSFEGNVRENWRRWKQEFELYLVATESDGKSEKVKSSILLTCIGKRAREIYNTFTFGNDEDKMKVKPILEKFTAYCNPRKNTTFLRYQFFSYNQQEGQPFDDFVTELKKRSEDCAFGSLKDSLICDRIVCGTTDNKLHEHYLRETDLKLEKAVQLGRAAEETRKHAEELKHAKPTPVDVVRQGTTPKRNKGMTPEYFANCKFCGRGHNRGNCPAYGKSCNDCGASNHFAQCCPRTTHRPNPQQTHYRPIREINRQPDTEEDECENFVGAITVEGLEKEINETTLHSLDVEDDELEWSVILESNGTNINYKLDTGSQVNVLPKKAYTKLIHKPKLHPAKMKLTAYNGTDIPVVGKCIVSLRNRNQDYKVLFIVAEMDSVPLLGLNTCKKLSLINRVMTVDCQYSNLIHEYTDCFGEIGSLSKVHHLTIDGNSSPVIQAPRQVPFALREKLKEELDRMVRLDIIDKVEGPTDWVSNLVIVEKPNGKLRVCLDPRDLNQAIKRQHYQLPTAEDILSKMAGAKYFSKLDASSGYWQLKLDEESSQLLAFHTPFGRYKFKRLPFGVNCASEIFQAEVTEILEGLEGCANAQDDIVVWGDTKDNHDRRLRNVLSRIRLSGLKLNRSKCIFGSNQITYLGQLLTSEGVKADPQKVSAIFDMPAPENKSDLQRFLGMVTYLGKFVPNLSEVSAPLRELLEKNVAWSFDTPQQQAFQELKLLITNSPVLKYFDPKLPIKVSSDASKSGLGATLEQKHGENWFPVAFASRSMNPAETNYAQIEKEILSIVFACERFNDFLYGQRFTVKTTTSR